MLLYKSLTSPTPSIALVTVRAYGLHFAMTGDRRVKIALIRVPQPNNHFPPYLKGDLNEVITISKHIFTSVKHL